MKLKEVWIKNMVSYTEGDVAKYIIKKIENKKNFISPIELSEILEIDKEKSLEILQYGNVNGIFINVTNKDDIFYSEYSVKEIILTEIESEIYREDLLNFNDFLKKYFGEIRKKPTITQDIINLREDVILLIKSKERSKATELIVKDFEKKNYIYTTKDDKSSEMWIYKDGIYLPEGKSYIKEFCRIILGYFYTSQLSNDVIEKIMADTFIEKEKFFINDNIYEIPIIEGILNIRTKEISPFSPKKIFFNKLNIRYNEDAKCPNIINHFKNILKEEEDYKVLLEIFGYCLLKENIFEKAFMFVGDGRNGKGKTLELLKRFVGIDNCSGVALGEMSNDSFKISEMFGKMVNLAGDIDNTDLKNTGLFKSITGRDMISAKRKFKNDIKFTSYAKNIFACNELPRVYDLSKGFWSRWILLEFPYEFIEEIEFNKLTEKQREYKKIKDINIIKNLTTDDELSGLLNESLKHLNNLLNNKKFSYSKGTQEIKDIWIRKSDSFTAFCFDFLEESPDNRIKKTTLKRMFYDYRKKHKLKGASDKSIKITLENLFGVGEVRDWQSGSWMWEGIKLKSQ